MSESVNSTSTIMGIILNVSLATLSEKKSEIRTISKTNLVDKQIASSQFSMILDLGQPNKHTQLPANFEQASPT
jgi:hypothetical protein